jgi:hypothetical protein
MKTTNVFIEKSIHGWHSMLSTSGVYRNEQTIRFETRKMGLQMDLKRLGFH